MQECNVQTFCTFAGSFVYKADTFFFDFGKRTGHSVFNGECEMMHATVTVVLFDELGNCAFGRSRFQQFDLYIAHFQESGSNFLIFHGFDVVAFQT